MAATAYAAVVSLLNTLDQIKIHPFLSTYFNTNYTIDSLRKKVDFLVDFVEKYSDIADTTEAEDLVRQIGDVAHEAEDLIEVDAADRIRTASTSKNLIMTDKLKKITQEMDCVMEKAIKAKGENGFINPYSLLPPASSSAPPPLTTENCSCADDLVRRMGAVAVEAEDIFEFQAADQSRSGSTEKTQRKSRKRKKRLVGSNKEKVIKSREKKKTRVYESLLTLHHFDVRAWVTVSQAFSATKIILQALSCLGGSTSDIYTSESDSQLGEELFKILYGRRYMIVLDDVWSVEAWEKIMFFFPKNNNGSRIIVTTRESELVDYFGSSALAMDFLDEKNSWELFCEKTFAQEGCPPELEEIGKEIVQKCKGLPLTITVFGGLLRKLPRMREYWEIIAKDKSLILESGEGNIKPLSILYLSYKHLPVWLKSCFLHLGLFPEDHEIVVSQLIKLWVAEGFVRSMTGQSLEEVAESYTKELVDRNLLLVVGLTLDKKLKSCRVHDVVRELCIKIGEKEKYFYVRRDISGMRQYIVDESTARLFYPREMVPSLFHPLILEGPAMPFKSRLLRVLTGGTTLLESCSQQVNLRFLFSDYGYAFHSSIQLLWSLQTLIIDCINGSFDAPCEIWMMPQLRHIEILESISLPDPLTPTCDDDIIVLQNLQTLKKVKNFKLSEEVCKRIPNIKELEIDYIFRDEARSCYHLHNVVCFNKLEALKLSCFDRWEYEGNLLPKMKLPMLPSSLKDLTLHDCKLLWIDMEMIASLPHLQFLKLGTDVVVGRKWNCVEGGFLSLRHLQIDGCDHLINLSTADSSSFPMLETLSLSYLSKLEEIPSGIGEIPTLERMYMSKCSESATMSAIEIMEEQEGLGNQSLQLTLRFEYETNAEMWRRKIQQLGITCQNLHIYCELSLIEVEIG